MDSLNKLIAHPTSEHLALLHFVLFAVLLVHVLYVGLVVGGTALSVLFSGFAVANGDAFARRAARRVVMETLGTPAAMLTLGILPIPVILFTCAQIVPDFAHNPVRFVALVLGGAVVAFGLLHAYAKTVQADVSVLKRLPLALAALGVFLATYLVFIGSISLLYDPEYWRFMVLPCQVMFSWHALAKFLQFLCFAGIAVGVRLVLLTPNPDDEDDAQFVATLRKHGAAHALGASMGLPLLMAFHSVHTPAVARSAGFYNAILVCLVFLCLGAHKLWSVITDVEARPRVGVQALVLLGIAVVTVFVQDSGARATALTEENALLVAQMDAEREEALAKYEAAMEEAEGGSAAGDGTLGEQVFKKVCSTCHAFDKKVVGPPLGEAAKKYAGNPQGLIDFVTSPRKIQPDFPNMPKLGLSAKDIRNVATYVLQQVGGGTAPVKPGGGESSQQTKSATPAQPNAVPEPTSPAATAGQAK